VTVFFNDKSEEPLKISKTCRDPSLGQDLTIQVNKSHIHLVIQSLKAVWYSSSYLFRNILLKVSVNFVILKKDIVRLLPRFVKPELGSLVKTQRGKMHQKRLRTFCIFSRLCRYQFYINIYTFDFIPDNM
jgi:hypothetical protein